MFKKLVQLGIQKIIGPKVSSTITKVDPFVPKNKSETLARDLRRARQQRKTSEVNLDNTVFRIEQESKKLKDMKTDKKTLSNTEKQKLKEGLYGGGSKLTKKAKGGRVGLKAGTNPFKKKSSTEKIKKTFSRDLGMQSVIYGLDKNKNVTKADQKAKFIAEANKKKKKKII